MNEPESVCVARSAADERRVERVLTQLAIPYTVRLEASEHNPRGEVCFQMMVYAVPQADAERARHALLVDGLGDRVLAGTPP